MWVTRSRARANARGLTLTVAIVVATAVPGTSFLDVAQAASPRGPARPSAARARLCSPVHVELANLPAHAQDPLILFGPGRESRPFPTSGSLCLTEPGIYHVVARPVLFKNRLGHWWHAYPTTESGVQRNEVLTVPVTSPPSLLPRVLSVNYYDQAPLTTVVLTRSDVLVPRGRMLPAFGALSVRRSVTTTSLRPGDIVVAPISAGLPHGLLGSVTATHVVGTTDQVVTSAVSPFRAFSRGRLVAAVARTMPAFDSLNALSGASSEARPRQSLTLGCGQSFTVSGSASFQPSASLNLGWSWGPWYAPWQANISGSFSLNPGVSTQVTVSAASGINCHVSEDLATVPIGSICTEFGCFTFNVVATATLGGSVGAAFSQTVHESITGGLGASFGFGYNGSNFQATNTLNLTGTSSSTTPWSGSVGVGVGPSLQVLYGIPDVAGVGPQVGVQDTATLTATPSGWAADAGVSASVGVAISALGFSYSDSVNIPIDGVTLDTGSWPTPPSPPLEVVASPSAAAPQTSADVSWQPPVWPGACGVSGYTVTAGPASTSVGSGTTSATLTGLTAGSTYTVTVSTTTNGCGSSQATAGVTTPPLTPPGPPAITMLSSPTGATQPTAAISFQPPPSCSGCAPATGYVITWSGDGTTGSATAPNSPATVSLPAFGTTYAITVSASSSAGTGAASDPSTFVPRSIPSAPLDLTVLAGRIATSGYTGPAATLNWQPPASDGGDTLTSYQISWTGGLVTQPASTGTAAVIHLTAYGATNTFCVTAINDSGAGPQSNCVSAIALTMPGAPGPTSATTASAGSTVVTWTAPASDGGAPVTGYEVDWAGSGTWGAQAASGTSATVTLPSAGVYDLAVFAMNIAGESPASPPVCVTVGNSAPCAPTITSTSNGTTEFPATVTWQAPAQTGGQPITAYTVSWTGAASGTLTRAASAGTSAVLSGLVVGTYSVTVRATTADGTSVPSPAATVTVIFIQPRP